MSDFTGGQGDDVFNGDGTNEVIRGKGGNDRLYGNGGSDTIEGGDGADYLDGGDGDDRLYSGNQVTISLPYYSTTVFSPPIIDSGLERDELYGGNGSDTIYAGYGDTVDGGANGSYGDYLYISFLAAPNGITFDGRLATQVVGGATITGIENISFVQGSNFDDTINGGSTGTGYSDFNALMGMGGNDTLVAGYYTGTLFGGDGNDIVDGRGSQYLQGVYATTVTTQSTRTVTPSRPPMAAPETTRFTRTAPSTAAVATISSSCSSPIIRGQSMARAGTTRSAPPKLATSSAAATARIG